MWLELPPCKIVDNSSLHNITTGIWEIHENNSEIDCNDNISHEQMGNLIKQKKLSEIKTNPTEGQR
jgi:hypothetical protein